MDDGPFGPAVVVPGMEYNDPLTYPVIGALMEVHNELGPGYLERIYQEAVARELALRAIPFEREVELGVVYKGSLLDATYRADFVVHGCILVELKALDQLRAPEKAQALHYLKSAGLPIALLVNFGEERLTWRRFFNGWHGIRAIRDIPVPVGASGALSESKGDQPSQVPEPVPPA